MKINKETVMFYPVSQEEQSEISAGWWRKAVWFIISNWQDIKNGLTDGYNTYNEKN